MDKEFWEVNSEKEFEIAVRMLEEINKNFLLWEEKEQYEIMEKEIRNLIKRLTSTLFFLKELERMK